MRISFVIKSLLAVTAVSVPLLVHAESNVQTGANTAAPGATAHVDFQITIPKVLFLRVGTGSGYATGTALTSVATVDLIQFAPAAGTVGNGTAVAGTGGDVGGGVVTAAIVSNSGNVTSAPRTRPDLAMAPATRSRSRTSPRPLRRSLRPRALPAAGAGRWHEHQPTLAAPATSSSPRTRRGRTRYATRRRSTRRPAPTVVCHVNDGPRDVHGDDAVTLVRDYDSVQYVPPVARH